MPDEAIHPTAVDDRGGLARAVHRPVDILVVDDDPAKTLAIESILEPLGQRLVKASSGQEALRLLLSRDFATIILDVHMPDMDGFETARMIRSRAKSSHTPIIFVSAINTDDTDAQRGYSLGAVDYIFAPIAPDVLRAKVTVFVDLHRKSEEVREHALRLEERTRQLEASRRELRLAERMATIGTLCAGLGHDMGNLLLPIAIWLEELRPERLPADLAPGVEKLSACVQYLRQLSSGLRLVALDPDRDSGTGVTDLAQWIAETGSVLRNALPHGVGLQVDIPPDLPPVKLSRHRLTQVVFNLVQNAGDALAKQRNGLVRLAAVGCAGSVRIEVRDNGPGMSPEVLARCFDPFFTTKTRAVSTGLGLSLVNGIIQKAGSEMQVRTGPSEGTTFCFALPAVTGPEPSKPKALVTLSDMRAKGFAVATLREAGFEIVGSLDDVANDAAIWVAEQGTQLDSHVARFSADRSDRLYATVGRDGQEANHGATNALAGGLLGLRSLVGEFRRRVETKSPAAES